MIGIKPMIPLTEQEYERLRQIERALEAKLARTVQRSLDTYPSAAEAIDDLVSWYEWEMYEDTHW